jgi:hypothetical protein
MPAGSEGLSHFCSALRQHLSQKWECYSMPAGQCCRGILLNCLDLKAPQSSKSSIKDGSGQLLIRKATARVQKVSTWSDYTCQTVTRWRKGRGRRSRKNLRKRYWRRILARPFQAPQTGTQLPMTDRPRWTILESRALKQ